jgi:hypothetical protein
MLPGENEQLSVLGRLPQESAIGVFEVPDSIAAVTVTVPDFPLAKVRALGAAVNAMVAGVAGGAGTVGAIVLGQLGA